MSLVVTNFEHLYFLFKSFLSVYINYKVDLKTETEKFIFDIIITNQLEYCESKIFKVEKILILYVMKILLSVQEHFFLKFSDVSVRPKLHQVLKGKTSN